MFTNVDDLFDFVEQRNRDLRRQASAYRQVQACRRPLESGPSLLGRLHALMARLHLVRPVLSRAEVPA